MAINFLDRAGRTAVYDYDKSIIGTTHFVNMKALAINGVGLNGYIHRNRIKGVRA